MHKAVDEMASQETFRGYGPEQGYDFLRIAIQNYYAKRNVNLDLNEIFISDGAKSDLGNILDLFDKDNTVLIPDPVSILVPLEKVRYLLSPSIMYFEQQGETSIQQKSFSLSK